MLNLYGCCSCSCDIYTEIPFLVYNRWWCLSWDLRSRGLLQGPQHRVMRWEITRITVNLRKLRISAEAFVLEKNVLKCPKNTVNQRWLPSGFYGRWCHEQTKVVFFSPPQWISGKKYFKMKICQLEIDIHQILNLFVFF